MHPLIVIGAIGFALVFSFAAFIAGLEAVQLGSNLAAAECGIFAFFAGIAIGALPGMMIVRKVQKHG